MRWNFTALRAKPLKKREQHLAQARRGIKFVKTAVVVLVTGLAAFVQQASFAQSTKLTATQASSQSNDFTFKRVKPPSAASQATQKRRINIQIEKTWPYETDPPKTKDPKAAENAPKPSVAANWFWKNVPDDLQSAGPSRISSALKAINDAPEQASKIGPNHEALNKMLADHGAHILLATAGKRISPAFVLAVLSVESAGKPQAISPKGAIGLMQLMPATAERFGVKDPKDPAQNIAGGVAYLDWLMSEFKGDPVMTLAGYNAGENAVKKHLGVPPFKETRSYIPKVIAAWDRARLYCQTLPQFADDGCVFAMNRTIKK